MRRATADQLKQILERSFVDSLPGIQVLDVKIPGVCTIVKSYLVGEGKMERDDVGPGQHGVELEQRRQVRPRLEIGIMGDDVRPQGFERVTVTFDGDA